MMQLAGIGRCHDGVLRAQLQPGVSHDGQVRALGGSLIVLFRHDPMPDTLGLWDLRVIRAGTDDGPEGRRFRGMLERVDREDVPYAEPVQERTGAGAGTD